MNTDISRNLRKTAAFILGMVILLLPYLTYIQIFQSAALASHPLNHRSLEITASHEQGKILDRKGVVLAHSKPDGQGKFQREYLYGPVFAHIIGYDSRNYGKTGVENSYSNYLSGGINTWRKFGAINRLIIPARGDDIQLTIDAGIQQVAYRALGKFKGAVVVMNPRTGELLALVSKPSFDPNNVDSEWSAIVRDPTSPLLDRATQGLYPPGSTIKIMMADAALKEGIADLKRKFYCDGSLVIGNYVLSESHSVAHGPVSLEQALTVSCNVTFGKLAIELGRDRLSKTFDRYGFLQPTDSELAEAQSHLPNFGHLSDGELAQIGIGQGSLLVTPLRMAMLVSAFANGGKVMEPFLASKVTDQNGVWLKDFSPRPWLTVTSPAGADIIRNMMITVVEEGTGQAAKISPVKVAGKTGTAENPHGAAHAWFVGFAPADNPEIAVAIIIENAGSGGENAAPIAKEIFAQALR